MKILDEFVAIKRIKEGYSLSRFGDGEMKMIWRRSSVYKLQKYDEVLREKLLRIFQVPLKRLLIGVPNPLCTRLWVTAFIKEFEKFVGTTACKGGSFVSAFFSRPSIVSLDSEAYFEEIKNLWKGREVVLINFNPKLAEHYLFRDSIVKFIEIPRRDCFLLYDKILELCKSYYKENRLFLVSAGPVATCLAYDIASVRGQCIDIGQIALEYSIFKGETNVEKWTSQNAYKTKRGYLRGKNDDVSVNIHHTKEKLQRRLEAGVVIDFGNAFRLINAFIYFADYVDKNLPLLDVGTREGWFLEVLTKAGFKDVQAIEVSPEAIAIVRANGWKITEIDAQKMDFQELFGTITAIHVLEHCSEPQKMVDNMYRALRKDGILYLEIPLELKPFPANSAHFSSFPEMADLFSLFGNEWKRLICEVVLANKAGTKRTLRSVWKKI